MEAEGYTMIEIKQGVRTLSEPTKNFREMVLEKKVLMTRTLSWNGQLETQLPRWMPKKILVFSFARGRSGF
nr:terminase [Brevibacillus laterosporus]